MEDCSICLEVLPTSENKMAEIKVLRCRHAFHTKCVDTWLERNGNCPLCRQKTEPPRKKQKNGREYAVAFHEYELLQISPLSFFEPSEEGAPTDSDDEKSIDYGDESDFEEELATWEEEALPRSFRISNRLVVSLI